MIIDRSGFFLIAGALAAGGVGGWVLRDSEVASSRPTPAAPAPAVTTSEIVTPEPLAVLVERGTAAAACDDSVGVPEACPSVGPSDEGVCSNIISKRCADYKAAFKPKVAQAAVACLRELKGNERCDPARVNLCGHSALMAACPEAVPPAKGNYVRATDTTPASFTLDDDPNPTPSPVTAACETLSKSCAGQSLTDCRQTLTGMNETGRNRTLECVAAHCRDRGLIGCEAVQDVPVLSQTRR